MDLELSGEAFRQARSMNWQLTRMHIMMRTLGVFALLLVLGSCTQTEPIVFPIELQLRPTDFPKEVDLISAGYDEVEGGVSRTASFGTEGRLFIVVNHELYLLEGQSTARDLYSEEIEKLFPAESWQPNEQFSFRPSNQEDQFKFACLESNLGGGSVLSCTLVQQHGRLVSIVHANLDGEILKIEDLEVAVRRLDRRISAWDDPG